MLFGDDNVLWTQLDKLLVAVAEEAQGGVRRPAAEDDPSPPRHGVRRLRRARLEADPLAALLEAARQSRAQEVIDGLPNGWDTLLSPEFRGGRDLERLHPHALRAALATSVFIALYVPLLAGFAVLLAPNSL